MNSRFTGAFAILTLLVAIIAFLLLHSDKDPGKNARNSSHSPPHNHKLQPSKSPELESSRSHPQLAEDNAPSLSELIAEYGEERVRHAQSIAPDYLTFGKRYLHLVDTLFESHPHAILVTQAFIANAFAVELTDEQVRQALVPAYEHALREDSSLKRTISRLEKRPEPILEFLLASDARAHLEITEEDFTSLREKHAHSLRLLPSLPNSFAREQRFWVPSAKREPLFRQAIENILTEEQLPIYREKIKEYDSPENQPELRGLASMPAKSLKDFSLTLRYGYSSSRLPAKFDPKEEDR